MWHYGQSAVAATLAVICSEIGDNTFFVAVILSMTAPRGAVFAGAMFANAIMHSVSVSLASLLHLIPHALIDWISVSFLSILGTKMIIDGVRMSPNKTEREYKEAEDDIKNHRKPTDGAFNRMLLKFVSVVFLEAFVLTFLGEWGDRSQLSTVLMAAHAEWSAVLLGGFAGHAFCLSLATIGGSYIARKVSVRAMTIVGGISFIVFALMTLLDVDD